MLSDLSSRFLISNSELYINAKPELLYFFSKFLWISGANAAEALLPNLTKDKFNNLNSLSEYLFINEDTYTKFDSVKTKNVCQLISNMNLKTNDKLLFVLTKPNKNLWLAARNLKNVELTTANCLNIEQLLKANHIILSNASLELINSIYGKNYE